MSKHIKNVCYLYIHYHLFSYQQRLDISVETFNTALHRCRHTQRYLEDGGTKEEGHVAYDEQGEGRDVDVEHGVPVAPHQLHAYLRHAEQGVVVYVQVYSANAVLHQQPRTQVLHERV